MKLKQQPTPETRERAVCSLEGSTINDLNLYAKLYEQSYGKPISRADLMAVIIKTFLEDDKAFQKFKKAAVDA